jgi:hypothetical protein
MKAGRSYLRQREYPHPPPPSSNTTTIMIKRVSIFCLLSAHPERLHRRTCLLVLHLHFVHYLMHVWNRCRDHRGAIAC